MLRTLGEACKVAQMTGENISQNVCSIWPPWLEQALSCEFDRRQSRWRLFGLDPYATSISARRAQVCERAIDQFFALTVLSDERRILSYVAGKRLTVS